MTIKPSSRDLLWMAGGGLVLLGFTLVALHFAGDDRTSVGKLARKASRVDAVGRIWESLMAASEAEKSAVLALTDQESQTFADQARAASADAERGRAELEAALKTSGTEQERSLLEQFSRAFAEFRHVDEELLALAVKNSNLKAYALTFGPAAKALEEADTALTRIATKNSDRPDGKYVLVLAYGAQGAALRIQSLLAPHVAEKTDERMSALEADMAKEDRVVQDSLRGLAAIQGLGGDEDLRRATSSYARFGELRKQILALSRENTNVRSTAISLSQKRKVMLVCLAALDALQQAILEEPPVGVDYGRFGRPAKLP